MGLDVGTLTGQIAIEDQFSSTLDIVQHRAEEFADSFMHGMGGVAMGVGLAVTAVVALTAATTALAVEGSHINDVTRTFEHFTQGIGGSEAALEAMRSGVKGTLTDMDLMTASSRMLAAGAKLSTDDLSLMSEAALVLKNRGLGPTKEMLDMIATSMVTGRTRSLSMRLGVVDAADTTREYAATLGLTKDQLSATQLAEAKRLTVLQMLKTAVADAGEQQLSFKDKIDRVETSVANWVEELEGAVASSPHLAAAFDAIMHSLEQFGDGKDLLQSVLNGVNNFADGVATYGPKVIAFFHDTYESIVTVVTFFKAAWDALPTGVQKLGVVAAETLGTVYLLNSALGVMGVGQITKAGFEAGNLAGKLSSLRSVTSTVTGALGLNTLALGSVAGALSTAAVVGFTAYEVWRIGSNWLALYRENAERAAAATRQQGFDTANLTRLNDAMGTSFKTVGEASAEWIKRQKEVPPALAATEAAAKKLAETQEAAAAAHKKAVDAVVDSETKLITSLSVERDAFQQLGDKVLLTTEGQKMFVTAMDKIRDSGRALTAEENTRYETIVRTRIATEDYQAGLLRLHGVTLEQIEAAKAQGKSEAEIAQSYRTSTEALKVYEDEKKKDRDLTREISSLELEWAGRSAEAAAQKRELARQDEINLLRGSAEEVAAETDKVNAKYELMSLTATKAWHEIAGASRSDSQQELADMNRVIVHMEMTGNYQRKQIDEMKAKRDALRISLQNGGSAGVAAENAVAEASQRVIDKWREQITLSEQLYENSRKLQNAITYQSINAGNFSQQIESLTHQTSIAGVGVVSAAIQVKNWSVNPVDLAKQGYSMDEIKLILEGAPIRPPQGPRIPGFAGGVEDFAGGMAMVGEHGPEIVRLPAHAQVVPGGRIAAQYGGMSEAKASALTQVQQTNHFYVNGTAEDVAHKISGILTQQATLNRLIPNVARS